MKETFIKAAFAGAIEFLELVPRIFNSIKKN